MALYRRGLRIIVDGLMYDKFTSALQKGLLPHLKKDVFDRALVDVDRAISCFPSATTECMEALSTGMYPQTPGGVYKFKGKGTVHNSMGLDAMGSSCFGHDTIFDYVRETGSSQRDTLTAAIFNTWHDGVDIPHPAWLDNPLINMLFTTGILGDRSVDAAVRRYGVLIQQKPITFADVYLPAYDRFGHTLSDRAYELKLVRLDQKCGELFDALRQQGEFDKTLIAFTSDHSMSVVPKEQQIDLNEMCQGIGLKPAGPNMEQGSDIMALAYGYSIGQVYLPERTGHDRMESVATQLVRNPAVDYAIIRDQDGRKKVIAKDWIVEIIRNRNEVRMEGISGSKPFGYDDDLCRILERDHSSTTSLEATIEQDQPDAVVSIAHSMKRQDSPDIRLVAKLGYDFSKTQNPRDPPSYIPGARPRPLRSHGTLHIQHRQVPFVIAGSQEAIQSKRKLSFARQVDFVPTLVQALGFPVPQLDGKSLL